ncbi:nitrate reductase molybdenum cofactor assembly chaperone [Tessaracoccus antarcticus]|uniref:Nitrate reductase molybdenum cofactor assembly chaperone n=1 Tax=Tessaracoccus antarcticus TaxID=2479848 RepID=A0A3M0G450_9ACTN|nr:nitrate reductase molybdenum cofactor assembly chaperone [Tessaracoccus antarcticus]RMB59760.1 nitrate reductase molybdenum cofactor assembly chaperone [Tessaracoccus antarcticus]
MTQRGIVYQAANLLLCYPTTELLDRLDLLREALAGTGLAHHFQPWLDQLATRPLNELQSNYIQEFDLSRRHSLHLSYWSCGDTRQRGMELLGYKDTFKTSGVDLTGNGELPDYLPAILEFAACIDEKAGFELLLRHRAELEMLRISVTDDHLPQAGVLTAVCATLPGTSPVTRDDAKAMLKATEKPESVGLTFLTMLPTRTGG